MDRDRQALAVSTRGWTRSKSSSMKEQMVRSMRRGRNMLGPVLMEKGRRSWDEQERVTVQERRDRQR